MYDPPRRTCGCRLKIARPAAAGVGFELGDANADGLVDATDLAILKASFGFEAPTGAVPEPAFASMLLLGAGALLRKRRSSV
ncbi:MAG TPA: PEP-CTERM sorting domain-containing protein [Phycisphaerae bacterium]|nr:PEP-CTERM sorting domain-containing protein [Phycisphaerae bacterium]